MIDATGYGRRIKQAVKDLISQIDERYSGAQFARDVGLLERGNAYADSMYTEWIAERSQPTIGAFMAMARVIRKRARSDDLREMTAGFLAFGEKQAAHMHREPVTETAPAASREPNVPYAQPTKVYGAAKGKGKKRTG